MRQRSLSLGRRGSGVLDRVAPRAQRARADALLTRWGALAVLVSRSVRIAAETLALLAGASPLSWRRFLPAAALGSLPPALLYAAAGASVIEGAQGVLVFGCVVAVAVLVWVSRLGRRTSLNAQSTKER